MITLLLSILAAMFIIGLFVVLAIVLLAAGPLGLIAVILMPFVVIDVLIVKLIKRRHKKSEDTTTANE